MIGFGPGGDELLQVFVAVHQGQHQTPQGKREVAEQDIVFVLEESWRGTEGSVSGTTIEIEQRQGDLFFISRLEPGLFWLISDEWSHQDSLRIEIAILQIHCSPIDAS